MRIKLKTEGLRPRVRSVGVLAVLATTAEWNRAESFSARDERTIDLGRCFFVVMA